MNIIFMIIGIICLANGIFMFLNSNFTAGVFITTGLGLLFTIWGVFYKHINSLQSGVLKFIKILIILGVCAEFLFCGFIALYGQKDTCDYKEDAVIVLGAGVKGEQITTLLKMRLDKTVEYHKKNPDALIVVTGGQGFQESVTEAYAMEKYLTENGVNPEIIVKEENATSTEENIEFSKNLLDTHFRGDYKAVIITSGFHIFRSVKIAKEYGIDNLSQLHSGIQIYSILPCYIRESMAVLKSLIF